MQVRTMLALAMGVAIAACSGSSAPQNPGGPPDGGTCQPVSCSTAGTCGPWPNGCGGSIDCGGCTGGESCGTGMTPGFCSGCSAAGWCREDPLPQGAGFFRSVFARTATDVWFTGDWGAVHQWDGAWHDRSSKVLVGSFYAGPDAVWGAASNDMWGVSFRGLWHWDGARWSLTARPGWVLNAISGTAAGDVWAVGDGGLVLHHDGSTWGPVTNPATDRLLSVYARSPTEVYVAGHSRRLMRWDGQQWLQLIAPDGLTVLTRVHASAPDDVWVLDGLANACRLESGTLVVKYGGVAIVVSDLWSFGPNDVWVAGWNGLVTHLGASGWVDSPADLFADFYDLSVAPNGDLWLASGSPDAPALRRLAIP